MEQKLHREGFTILEVTLVVAISTIIIFGVFGIFQAGSEQTQLSQTKMTLEDSIREALYKMAQEIRQSSPSRITIAADGSSIDLSVPDPENLVDAAYAVKWSDAHTIRYAPGGADNRQLLRTDTTADRTTVIANNITAIQFAGNAAQPTVVTITISAQQTLINGRQVPETPIQRSVQVEVRNPS